VWRKEEAAATAVTGTSWELENGSGEVMGSKEGLASKIPASGVIEIETEAAAAWGLESRSS
jgi:hypothetical protein